ncbi:MAG: hypothetical protein KDD53_04820 [Bdellovibrionales bacterium]|nr:hypothetical protein [Bdellovibrionales bacterium]
MTDSQDQDGATVEVIPTGDHREAQPLFYLWPSGMKPMTPEEHLAAIELLGDLAGIAEMG